MLQEVIDRIDSLIEEEMIGDDRRQEKMIGDDRRQEEIRGDDNQ